MSFNHIRKLDVPPGATSEFTFYQIQGRPTLTVRPTGEANPPYMNAMFKRSKGVARRLRSGDMSVDLLEETRDIDLKLYPKYVVTGWKDVETDSGDEAPFNAELVAQFLDALPEDLFDELRAHCGDLSNFRDDPEDEDDGAGLHDDDVEAIAGN